jgi:hypothetical protein
MELSASFEVASCSTYSRISQHFRVPESSLLCSKDPSTGSYPEMNSVHTTPSYLSKIHFNNILTLASRSCCNSLSFWPSLPLLTFERLNQSL